MFCGSNQASESCEAALFKDHLFRKGVYAEVEKDTAFTTTAWIIVAVVAFLNQVGTYASGELANWLIGASFLVPVIALAASRIPREEKMMLDHFGDDYRRYMRRTGRLLPRVSW